MQLMQGSSNTLQRDPQSSKELLTSLPSATNKEGSPYVVTCSTLTQLRKITSSHCHVLLNDRSWVCPKCGQVHDRDVHAAQMILRRGIYELESNGKTIEPLGFKAIAFESRISRL